LKKKYKRQKRKEKIPTPMPSWMPNGSRKGIQKAVFVVGGGKKKGVGVKENMLSLILLGEREDGRNTAYVAGANTLVGCRKGAGLNCGGVFCLVGRQVFSHQAEEGTPGKGRGKEKKKETLLGKDVQIFAIAGTTNG